MRPAPSPSHLTFHRRIARGPQGQPQGQEGSRLAARRLDAASQCGESCGSGSPARVYKQPRLYSNVSVLTLDSGRNFHVLDNEQDAMLILVIIESTMTGLRRRRGSGLRGPSRQHSQSCIHLLSDIA